MQNTSRTSTYYLVCAVVLVALEIAGVVLIATGRSKLTAAIPLPVMLFMAFPLIIHCIKVYRHLKEKEARAREEERRRWLEKYGLDPFEGPGTGKKKRH